MRKKAFFCLVCLLILLSSLYGIKNQAQDSDSRTIQVDVIVTKNDEALKDLTESDFKLFEDGKEVPISSFKLIEKESGVAQKGDGKNLTVIFHDVSFWETNVKPQVDELMDALVNLSQQGIEIMILQLDWQKGLEILQPFTSDEELIRKASQASTRSVGEDKIYGDLGVDKIRDPASATDAQAIAQAERGVLQAYLNIERQRFEKVMGGILTACNMVKSFPGRKSILLISNGIPDLSSSNRANILESDKSGREALDAIHNRDQGRIGTLRIFDPFNIMSNKNFRIAEEVIQEVARFANSQNISIYALDPGIFSSSLISGSSEFFSKEDLRPRSLLAEERKNQLQNLRFISEETNAILFRGANKYDNLHLAMNTDLSSYYQLSFIPKRKKADNQYHKIDVEISHRDANVRFRKGYRDYSQEDAQRILLVSAYYSPETFKQLPFEAEFIPFYTDPGTYMPWMGIALPTKELLLERLNAKTSKTFHLNIWLRGKSGEKGFGGKIDLPMKINSSFLDYVRKVDYLWFFFTGPDLHFDQREQQAIFALVDPQTYEIGTQESFFSLPHLKKDKTCQFMNCVLGSAAKNPEKRKEIFLLNKKNGSLEYGQIRFFPQVTNRFSRSQEYIFAFLQIYCPQEKGDIQPEFLISGNGIFSRSLQGEVVAESWNKKTKVWSGIYKLDFASVDIGDYVFHIRLPVSGGEPVSSQELRLTKLSY